MKTAEEKAREYAKKRIVFENRDKFSDEESLMAAEYYVYKAYLAGYNQEAKDLSENKFNPDDYECLAGVCPDLSNEDHCENCSLKRLKMKTLQITEANARKLYKNATPEFKTTLEDTFGKEYFSRKITDCKTYEEVCDFIGEVPINESILLLIGFTYDEICYRKLKTITKALNEGWTPNWSDGNEKKWYPYFDTSSDFAFLDTSYYYSHLDIVAGSHLCFKSKELAEYAGRQFIDIYKRFIL